MQRHAKRNIVALLAILVLYAAFLVVAATCEISSDNELGYWYEDQHNLSAWAVYQQKETKDARK